MVITIEINQKIQSLQIIYTHTHTNSNVKTSKMPKKIYNQRINYWNNSKNYDYSKEKYNKKKKSTWTHKTISFKF